MKYLLLILVILLTIYAPLELTRMILWYMQGYPVEFHFNSMGLELFVMWLFYGCAILLWNWRL